MSSFSRFLPYAAAISVFTVLAPFVHAKKPGDMSNPAYANVDVSTADDSSEIPAKPAGFIQSQGFS